MEEHIKHLAVGSNGHMYVVGQSGSGKSYLVFKTLLSEKLRHVFDEIIIFTMSYESNKQYYDALHLQDRLTHDRRKRAVFAMRQGRFDSFLQKSYDEFGFRNDHHTIDSFKKLPKERQEIVVTDLESNHLEMEESDSKQTRIYKTFDEAKLFELFQKKTQYPDQRWLIVFDDCTYDDSFTQSKGLKMLLRNGRAKNINVWVLSQKSTDLHPKLRSQFSMAVVFYSSNQIERHASWETFGIGRSEHDFTTHFYDHFKRLPKHTFAFVILTACDEGSKIFFNFENSAWNTLNNTPDKISQPKDIRDETISTKKSHKSPPGQPAEDTDDSRGNGSSGGGNRPPAITWERIPASASISRRHRFGGAIVS